jgi:hypothetical protein
MPAAVAVATLALATSALPTSAFAGDGSVSLSQVSGGVLVNQGHGFRPATPGMTLHPGDRVLVTLNGGAGLNWSGGCGVALGAGSMATISNATPCTSGARTAGIVSPNSVAKPNLALQPPISPIGSLHGLGGGGQSQSP